MGVLKANVDGNWEPISSLGGEPLPAGGSTSQRLTKKSSVHYDAVWAGRARNEYAADTAWHEVGTAGEATFQNGWTNYPAWGTAAYRIDGEGWVHLKGLVMSGTAGPIFTLPLKYRPWKIVYAPTITDPGGVGYLQINPDGTIGYWLGWGTNAWLNLSGVRFPAWNRWSQFAGRYFPLEGTQLRSSYNEYPVGLWPQPNGMTRVFGISGPYSAAAVVTNLNNIGGHVYTTLFGAATEDQSGSRCFQISNRNGFYFNGPAPATNWAMLSSEFGTMACEDQWIAPTLLNGWINHGPDSFGKYGPAGYWKDSAGVVHLRGLLRNGAAASSIMLTLPAGYRPNGNFMWFAGSGITTSPCRIDIWPDGTVLAQSGGSTGWTSLDGINFYAADS